MYAPAYSGFPVELVGAGEVHAAFLNESRTRRCGWSPVQEIRIHGPKTMFFQSPPSMYQGSCPQQQPFVRRTETLEGLRPVFFGPCTLGRTWGTRPGKQASLFAQGRSQALLTQL
jgi:hypothetical protein